MCFEKNVGFKDKAFRFLLGILFLLLGIKYSPWFYVLAVIAFLTSIFGWCPLYSLFHVNTMKRRPSKRMPMKKTVAKKAMPKKATKKSRKPMRKAKRRRR